MSLRLTQGDENRVSAGALLAAWESRSQRPLPTKRTGLQTAEKVRESPEGTAELSPGRQSWEISWCRCSPVGTAENCLRQRPGWLSVVPAGLNQFLHPYPGLASWAKFS
jgi:hypothetical protein